MSEGEDQCTCGCLRVWTKHGWLCLHCDLDQGVVPYGQPYKPRQSFGSDSKVDLR